MAMILKNLANNQNIDANYTSEWCDVRNREGWCMSFVYTGAPTGNIFIDAWGDGVDLNGNGDPNQGVEISTFAIDVANLRDLVQDNLIGYSRVRFRYVAAGTGFMTATIVIK